MKGFLQVLLPLMAFIFLVSLSSCKGRTVENMTPKGETIEVVISQDEITDIVEPECDTLQISE